MEDFGELPEGDHGQLEGHRTFRPFEAYPNTSLAGRQENGGVHAEAPDFASYLHQDGGSNTAMILVRDLCAKST